MYYLEYHELLKKYREADKNYIEVLEKGNKLLLDVLPKATKYQEILINHTNVSSDEKLIRYISEIRNIENMINESKNVKTILDYELKKLKLEMKESKNVYDKVYYYHWIEKKSPYKFNKIVGYSKSQIYKFIAEIKQNLYKNEKVDKSGQN